MSNGKRNSFLMQGSILAAASIIVRLIGLFYRVPMTNILGDEGIGNYSVAFEIYNIGLLLSSYSLPLALSKLVSAKIVKKEYKNAQKTFWAAMYLAVGVGLAMSLIIYFGAELIGAFMGYPRSSIALKVLAPTIFVFSITGVLRGYFQGRNTMIPTSISQIVEQIVNAVVSIAAPWYLMHKLSNMKDKAAYAAAGGTFGTFMGVVTALVFLMFVYMSYRPRMRRQCRKDKTEETDSYGEIYRMLIATIIPVVLSQTVYQISGIIDSALLGNISEAQGLKGTEIDALWGIYSGKYRLLTNVPVAIASALGTSMIPSIMASRVEGKKKDVKYKVRTNIKFNMLIAFPSAVGMGVLASPILRLLLRDARPLTAQLLQIGSVAIVFFALSTITNAVLQGIDLMKLSVIHSAISLALHVVLVYVLLKFFDLGVYGLVIGNVTFALVVCILNWRAVGKNLRYRQEVVTTFVMPLVCSGIMGGAAYFIYKGIYALTSSNLIGVLVTMLIAVVIYGVLLLLFRVVDREELRDMPMGMRLARIADKLHLLR